MPFNKVPTHMVVELVHLSVFWLNTFPATDGISKTMSPRTIIFGSKIDFNKHCKIEFGAYVQTHEEHNNSMATRTTGATGRCLNRHNWTPLPMPQDVIERVHKLARRSYINLELTFAWRNGKEIPDTIEIWMTTPTPTTSTSTMAAISMTMVMMMPTVPLSPHPTKTPLLTLLIYLSHDWEK